MTPATLEALRVSDAGLEAGNALWAAIDAANIRREVLAFECALQTISEEIPYDDERELFYASAMKAIPLVMLTADQRTQIAREYDAAYVNLVHARQADEEAAAADWAYDSARDERMMGDAA